MMKKTYGIITPSIAVVLLAGCSTVGATAPAGSGRAPGTSDADATTEGTLHGSIPVDYLALGDLRTSADAVIRGTAVKTEEFVFQEVPHTRTTFKVTEVIAGQLAVDTIIVRQAGTAQTTFDAGAPALRGSQEYLLYVEPFEFVKGQPEPGEYVIVGPGAWEKDTKGAYKLFRNGATTVDVGKIPTLILPTEVSAQLSDK